MQKEIIRTIIVDDERRSSRLIHNLLSQYCPQVNVIGLAENVSEAREMIDSLQPDLVLLDIEMPHENGFHLLSELPEVPFDVIFITGYDHYALKAIKFQALDYLLKPVDVDELIGAIEKVSKRRRNHAHSLQALFQQLSNPDLPPSQIAIPIQKGRIFLRVSQIVRCEADGAYTWIYPLDEKRVLSTQNLGEYEKLLPGAEQTGEHTFFRVHYSHLVNLHYIREFDRYENELLLTNGYRLPIAQRRKQTFITMLKKMGLY
ncbi:MAG: LytTR family DNA-binding domain-containing protein [Bacteroidota bacterium]